MENATYINAGAGSGKTWTLSHRLSDLLLTEDKDKRVEPSQVILTTFTRAAAAEFREKARSVLIEAGKPEVAAALEGAAIGTVHSVCEQFIKKYWYRLGLSPEMGVLQDEDKIIYIEQSIASILKGKAADIILFDDFRRDFKIVKQDNFIPYPYQDWWKDSLKSIISMMSYYGITNLENSIKLSCSEIDSIFTGPELDTTALLVFLDKYEEYVKTVLSQTARKAEKDIRKIRRKPQNLSSIQDVISIVDLTNFVGGAKKGSVAFLKMFPDVDLDKLLHNLRTQTVSKTFGTRIKEVIAKIFGLAAEWLKEYKRFKELNHVLDFDDLEQNFLKMLKDPEFEDIREEIKSTFKLLMVDEFQDCNPVQIAIFDVLSKLIADGGGSTVCVGDPKQSIYAFRGSDLDLVKEQTAKFKKDKPLDTSYRSRPHLVNLSNKVFLQAFKDVLNQDEIELPNKARLDEELSGHEPIHHWNITVETGEQLETKLAAKIFDILYTNPWTVCLKKEDDEKKGKEVQIKPKDIAVLCRSGDAVKRTVAALRNAGVPVSSSSMDIINWAECQLLLALLRWMNNPDDDGAKADIWHLMEDVSSETILLDRYDYLSCETNEKWLGEKELFKKLAVIRERVRTLPVSTVVSTLVLELDLMRLCQKWGNPIARCQNLGLIQKISKQYEEHCLQMNLASSISGFISYIHKMPDDLKNEDTTSNTVKVITYHKSKGLEWPVVILNSLNREIDKDTLIAVRNYTGITNCKTATGETQIFFFPPIHGSQKELPGAIQEKVMASPLFQDIKQRFIREETRLLYVGLTRARDYVVTLSKNGAMLNWLKDCGCGSGNVTMRNGKVNPWGQDGFEAEYCNVTDGIIPSSKSKGTTASEDTLQRANIHVSKFVSPSKLSTKMRVELKVLYKGQEILHSIKSKDAATCGTCVHNFFAAFNPELSDAENVAIARRLIDGAGLAEQLTSPESIVESAKQFFSWLNDNYPGAGEMSKEVPFMLRADGKLVSDNVLIEEQVARGEIDLVWIRDKERKTCVLIDYKSYHGSPNLNSSDEEVRKHYQGYTPQLLVYKTALEKAGWNVEDVLVYYFIQGRVVRFDI